MWCALEQVFAEQFCVTTLVVSCVSQKAMASASQEQTKQPQPMMVDVPELTPTLLVAAGVARVDVLGRVHMLYDWESDDLVVHLLVFLCERGLVKRRVRTQSGFPPL